MSNEQAAAERARVVAMLPEERIAYEMCAVEQAVRLVENVPDHLHNTPYRIDTPLGMGLLSAYYRIQHGRAWSPAASSAPECPR
jgi:hypothetical protein